MASYAAEIQGYYENTNQIKVLMQTRLSGKYLLTF